MERVPISLATLLDPAPWGSNASLSVATDQTWATVRINGVLVGWTPLRVDVLPGTVRVLVESEFFGSWATALTLTAGDEAHLEPVLRWKPVRVVLDGWDRDVLVRVDGEAVASDGVVDLRGPGVYDVAAYRGPHRVAGAMLRVAAPGGPGLKPGRRVRLELPPRVTPP